MKLLAITTPALAIALALAACSGPATAPATENVEAPGAEASGDVIVPDDETAGDADDARDPTGRWTGVEGMYLDVKGGGAPGRYRLTMQWNLDDKGVFEGTARGDDIVFERNGVRETLRPTDGAATGLKYLAGKNDCLTVRAGEGYCRD